VQPQQLRAKGWRSWPLDKCIKVGEPTTTKPNKDKGPDMFATYMLSKEPDQMNFRAAPDPLLNTQKKIEMSAVVADRRAQRVVVLATVGYFWQVTISREFIDGVLSKINSNLSAIFGDNTLWTTSQVRPARLVHHTACPCPGDTCLPCVGHDVGDS
jgi:hypothetical protein